MIWSKIIVDNKFAYIFLDTLVVSRNSTQKYGSKKESSKEDSKESSKEGSKEDSKET